MQLYITIAIFATVLYSAKSQIYSTYNLITVPAQNARPGVILAPPPAAKSYAHPKVVQNAIVESQLPPQVLNPFYKNPAIAAALAEESWFKNKEFPVFERETEHIPRSEIYKIFQRAGFNSRR